MKRVLSILIGLFAVLMVIMLVGLYSQTASFGCLRSEVGRRLGRAAKPLEPEVKPEEAGA